MNIRIQSLYTYILAVMNSVKPTKKQEQQKAKPEVIVEKMEGGILVRRYNGKKVEVETKRNEKEREEKER